MTRKGNPSPAAMEAVRKRDGGCVRCGRSGGNTHHRKLRVHCTKAEVHLLTNMIVLCGSGTTGCHGWVHRHPEESYKAGWLVRSWEDPESVPVFDWIGDRWLLHDDGTRSQLGRRAS